MHATASHRVHSGDADIIYRVMGDGPPVVLLHPFPVNHAFWLPVTSALSSHYRLLLPDLRGHGDSEAGEGSATMAKHATDVAAVMDDAGAGRASMIGVSIGGYILFDFWRRHRARVASLGLFNTKAPADSAEARASRLQAANDVHERGTELFFQSMVPKVFGKTTRETRPDLVEGALRLMREMSAEDVAQVQRGMAERPDSIAMLKSVNVPTLIVTGDEDLTTGPAEAELMHRNIPGSQLKVIPRAGHYSAWERPAEVGSLVRDFLQQQKNW